MKYGKLFLIFFVCVTISHADSLQKIAVKDRTVSIYSQPYFQSWQISDRLTKTETEITQFTIPWTLAIDLSHRTRVIATQSNLKTELGAIDLKNGQDLSNLALNGWDDLRVQLTHQLTDSLIFVGGLGAPTGKSEIDLEKSEDLVLKQLFNDALDFEIGRLGEGWTYNGGLTFAKAFKNITIGAGANYLFRDDYKRPDLQNVIENPIHYPGNDITLTAGFTIGHRFQLRSDLIYTIHSPQKLGDQKYFQQGDEWIADGVLSYRNHKLQIDLFGEFLNREVSLRPDQNGDLKITDNSPTHRLNYGFKFRYRPGNRSTISAIVANKTVLDRYRDRIANVWAFDLDHHFQLTRIIGFTFGAKLSDGQLIDQDTNLSGLGYYGAITTSF